MNNSMTIYEQWADGVLKNISNFQKKIFEAYQVASGNNMAKLRDAFPELFVETKQP